MNKIKIEVIDERVKIEFEFENAEVAKQSLKDEMFIDDECVDSETHRTVFQLIFKAMHQDQHYNMMMGDE